VCTHCGQPCPNDELRQGEARFCCLGCKTVYELLHDHQLDRYYALDQAPGSRPSEADADRFAYLDDPGVRRQLVDFDDGHTAVTTLQLPTIHCVACLWLLENLYRLESRVQRVQVDFLKKQATIHFDPAALPLKELVALLTRLGYEPRLRLHDLAAPRGSSPNRALYLKLAVAGFAFSNVMLLSFPGYLGLTTGENGLLLHVFGYLSLGLSLPVLLYSASEYWRAGWRAVRRREINIELPISIGILALYGHSLVEILRGAGGGYLDSFTGLIFFLLLGRVFQQKTYASLAFDHDYTAYFPVSVTRRTASGSEERIPLTRLQLGDRIVVRHREIVPADAVLRSERTEIDYSFVTGEADPVARQLGELVYAGGRQIGPAAELEVVKAVNQSYLTQLWDNPLFRKTERHALVDLTNRISKRFTVQVLLVALVAGLWWLPESGPTALKVMAAVLIVACPCALALAAPFTMGTLLRLAERHGCFTRNTGVLEALAQIDTIVLDKTGTLTADTAGDLPFTGTLSPTERELARALARQSTHPLSVRLAGETDAPLPPVRDYREEPGAGLAGQVGGLPLRLGSAAWTGAPAEAPTTQPVVHLAIAGQYRGYFTVETQFRGGLAETLAALQRRYRLVLLSGDTERQAARLRELFGPGPELRFRQSPADKLRYVAELQAAGHRVLMVGDGLNDAGALRQSNVGIAVASDLTAFAPACDIILDARRLTLLPGLLRLARAGRRIVIAAFVGSFAYNLVGLSYAAANALSPLVSAILMPVSSVTIVTFTVVAATLAARRCLGDSRQ
jgi:Cu+-exporting ATPase